MTYDLLVRLRPGGLFACGGCRFEPRNDLGELGVRLAGTVREAWPLRRDRLAIRDRSLVRKVHAGLVVLMQRARVLETELGLTELAPVSIVTEGASIDQVGGVREAGHACW